MWHQQLMSRIIAADSILSRIPVAAEFNQHLCPAIMRRLADVPALGGDPEVAHGNAEPLPAGVREITPAARQRFSHAPDQSLAAHLINGVFVGLRLAGHFPDHFAWDPHFWHLWVLGVVFHDYGKAVGKEVSPASLDAARDFCRQLGEDLDFEKFFPGWVSDLDDILFLAQNTQTMRGANLDLRAFDLHIHPKHLDHGRMLASFADVLLHVAEPREVATQSADGRSRHINLREKLSTLFPPDQVPRLVYHQMAEVRGLLTNILHNAAQQAFSALGYLPYLYFADGVVYLAPSDQHERVDLAWITETAWQVVVQALTVNPAFGLRRANVGIKAAPPLYDLLNAEGFAEAGRRYASNITNAVTRDRLAKMGKTDTTLAIDVRCDQLAEFLVFLKRNVIEALFTGVSGVTGILLARLGLSGIVSETDADYQEGGVGYGWFYVASQYITRNSGLSPEELPNQLTRLSSEVLADVRTRGAVEQHHATLRTAFDSYVARVLDLNGIAISGNQPRQAIEAEFTRYINSKASNRAICSLCSTPYESQEQAETVVLFKPQQYSAKNRLGGSRVTRGICPICSLEMLLRQARQDIPSGKFQDQKAVQLMLYPSYFFTPETAQLVKACAERLNDLNLNWGAESLLATLRKTNSEGILDLDALVDYEHFLADEIPQRRRTLRATRPEYSTHELTGLIMLSLLPQKSDPTDTDAWILPAFYALALPLLLNVKSVASTSFVPLYSGGSALIPTTVMDGTHPAVRLALNLGKDVSSVDQFRVGRLKATLKRLLAFYDLHTDVFAEGFDAHWGQLAAVVRDVATDPYNVFAFYDRKKRGGATKIKQGAKGNATPHEGVSPWDQRKYLDMYATLGGDSTMGTIGNLVTSYAQFYRAQGDKLGSAYSVLKPLATAIDVTVNSLPNIAHDDLVEIISGSLHDLMERVRDKQADGWDPILTNRELGTGVERIVLARQRIHEFAERFVTELFLRECDGDRAVLRERANQLRSAARFYYLTHYAPHAVHAQQ